MAGRVSPELKAAALADLYAGEQPAVVAERYRISPATVRSWKLRTVRTATEHATEHATRNATIARPMVEAQQHAIGVIILDLLAAKLQASAAIARIATSNPEWVWKQSGSELAAFGQWLDNTALAIGDRLAGTPRGNDGGESGV